MMCAMKRNVILCVAAAVALAAWAPARGAGGVEMGVEPGGGKRLQTGTWGGEHVRLVVETGGAQVEFDCARGTLEGPLVLDARGRFVVRGTYVREFGPIRLNRPRPSVPTRYEGRLSGRTLTLTVTPEGSEESVGTFTLARGSEGRLRKCR